MIPAGDNDMIKETHSSEETEKLGYETGNKAKAGDIFCLSGDLGVGKTVFKKGFAKGLGMDKNREKLGKRN